MVIVNILLMTAMAMFVTETIITVVLHRKMKKKLDKERELHEAKRIEYEKLIQALPIQRNLL